MISIILIILAGICNAVMDTLQFNFNGSIFFGLNKKYWNPAFSWMNKWKYKTVKNAGIVQRVKVGEKFLGSSTVFVFLTDAWHLFKFLMICMISAAIVLYKPIMNDLSFVGILVNATVYYLVFTVTFELFYSKILRK